MRSADRTPSAYYCISCLGAVAARRESAIGQTASTSCACRRTPRVGDSSPDSILTPRSLFAMIACTAVVDYQYNTSKQYSCTYYINTSMVFWTCIPGIYNVMNNLFFFFFLAQEISLQKVRRTRKLKNEVANSRVIHRHLPSSENLAA